MPKIEQEFYNMTMNLLSFQNLLNKNNKEFKYFDTESISNILNIYREINLSDNIDRSDIIKFEKMLTNFKIQENSIGISL